ncbi:ribonucleoside-diphosphate reductase [Bacillus phage B4]|uniref:ribonucleoside-diphosphate reductase n=2 Tax=Bequatrovirus B4 TaxID=1918005 RepID=J9PQJ7_9CAUD|nr:ribonucleoside-diphosphate reductase [Bacillus phage B4]YP_009783805.1 putative ribonucleotide-diphosphate reductase beta subunit [Bacillus phage B5S]MEB9013797.1 ribonucleotide-diphosphate reductase subunit beta [Bacillus cereus]AEW47443.1 putative ribonucleotide-diphosphate reductase beta subunit [Bacillus phage B5S]AEZ66008.1 ribonucleoside-diphosphate reductase [Bacillus phage B4]MEB9190588.1 ribonucleotide-diphosphate reductase subunit beta [Bacillus cereus]
MFNKVTTEKPFRIYNAMHPNRATKLFGGVASGIRNWDDQLVDTWLDYQKALFAEYWVPEEVRMGKDIEQYKQELTPAERVAYERVSGALNWLDSMASDIVTMLFMSTSDPALRTLLTIIASFETMHNVSYEHMTSTVIGFEEKQKEFAKVRELPLLAKRNDFILKELEEMVDMLRGKLVQGGTITFTEDEITILFKGLVAYQILEGEYFSGGFVYFHSLARDNKMIESNNLINLIKADENQHSEIFGLIIKVLVTENPHLNNPELMDWAMNYIRKAVELEKEWTAWLYQDIDTLSVAEYHDYAEYLANLICRNAGLKEPFPSNTELKSKWIVTYGSKSKGSGEIAPKSDFLQGNAINYKHEDGDDFDL